MQFRALSAFVDTLGRRNKIQKKKDKILQDFQANIVKIPSDTLRILVLGVYFATIIKYKHFRKIRVAATNLPTSQERLGHPYLSTKHLQSHPNFSPDIGCTAYTGCFKKSFTNLKAYRNLYRGRTQRFELSKCSRTHRVLPRIVMVQCDFQTSHL